jgi:hypothetical protein
MYQTRFEQRRLRKLTIKGFAKSPLFKKRQLSGVGVFGETKEVIDALTRLQQGVK